LTRADHGTPEKSRLRRALYLAALILKLLTVSVVES
jgi:hypothetical protein